MGIRGDGKITAQLLNVQTVN